MCYRKHRYLCVYLNRALWIGYGYGFDLHSNMLLNVLLSLSLSVFLSRFICLFVDVASCFEITVQVFIFYCSPGLMYWCDRTWPNEEMHHDLFYLPMKMVVLFQVYSQTNTFITFHVLVRFLLLFFLSQFCISRGTSLYLYRNVCHARKFFFLNFLFATSYHTIHLK